MDSKTANDVVRVALASNSVEAHLMEQALEEEGIECKVVGDYLEAGLAVPTTHAEVWVHQSDLAAAETILQRSQEHPGTEIPDETDA